MSYQLEGELTRDTCTHQLEVVKNAVEAGARAIDLSAVTRVDSTALAFWMALERWSRLQSIDLSWSGLPEQMVSIAQLVGVDELIHA